MMNNNCYEICHNLYDIILKLWFLDELLGLCFKIFIKGEKFRRHLLCFSCGQENLLNYMLIIDLLTIYGVLVSLKLNLFRPTLFVVSENRLELLAKLLGLDFTFVFSKTKDVT